MAHRVRRRDFIGATLGHYLHAGLGGVESYRVRLMSEGAYDFKMISAQDNLTGAQEPRIGESYATFSRCRKICRRSSRLHRENTIRAHLAEFSITESIGRSGLHRLIEVVVSGEDDRLTDVMRRAMITLVDQYRLLQGQILDLDRQVMACHRSNEASRRLATIPGIGLLAASALVASIGNASSFKNGRSFAAFIGLVPKQSSSGGKERLEKISKRGDHLGMAIVSRLA